MSFDTVIVEKPLVLVADDDPTHCVVIREILQQVGFRVLTTADGKAALESFAKVQPDIVLLDVEMPELDGFSVCEAIRSQARDRETPIIMVTGLEDEESVEQAYRVGATDFISKPINWALLPHRIRYVLRESRSSNDLRDLVRTIPDLIFIVNEDGEAQDEISGRDSNNTQQLRALTTASKVSFYPCESDDKAKACIRKAIDSGKPQVYEHELEEFDVFLETRFVARDKNSVLAIVRDITERKKSEAKIHNLAYYDELTALPNRQLFSRSLQRTIKMAERDDRKFAILFMDLDRFKRINDTLGHSIGDKLLKEVAARLEKCTRATDDIARFTPNDDAGIRLARLGGDEFVIMLYGIDSEAAVTAIASRIISVLAPPCNCDGHQFVVTPSIGIALYPQDGETHEELLMNADSAMYRAKSAGRNNYKFYSQTMRTKSLHRLDLETEIRKAIDDQQFELYYQPKVDIETWSVVGAEALLRWHHPKRGNIAPGDFISVAEETGLIVLLEHWVLHEACKQLKAWSALPSGPLPVSVNISGHHFHADGLIDEVLDAVSAADIEAGILGLEITESVLLTDMDNTIIALEKLKDAGISLSIDDFGTGYSSLGYLKRFPVDMLKIDRSFVRDIHKDKDDAAICAAILAMAKHLELEVIAVGVELEEQLAFLRHHGCNQIQGFIYSQAVPAAQFAALLVERPRIALGKG